MNRIVAIIFLILVFYAKTEAQELNIIVPGTAHNIPDGWHIFIFQGVKFDVEVKDELLKKGVVIWQDKSRYSGDLKGYSISGKGTYIWKNRERYEGAFKNNMRHGKGTMFYKDDTKHYGKWKHNKKNGRGQEYDKDGELIRDGIWKDDIFIKEIASKKTKS